MKEVALSEISWDLLKAIRMQHLTLQIQFVLNKSMKETVYFKRLW